MHSINSFGAAALAGALAISCAACRPAHYPNSTPQPVFHSLIPPIHEPYNPDNLSLDERVQALRMSSTPLEPDVSSPPIQIVDQEWKPTTRKAISFVGIPRDYISSAIKFIERDLHSRGIKPPSLDTVTISIVTDEQMKIACTGLYGGCYRSNKYPFPAIFISPPDPFNNNIDHLFSVTAHELGHHLFQDKGEYGSEGLELYMTTIKLYQFSKPLGSLTLKNYFQMKGTGQEELEDEYTKARLHALINLLDNECDVELAMKSLLETPRWYFEKRTKKIISNYSEQNAVLIYHDLWNSVLQNPQFKTYLGGPTGHLSVDEADEFISQLKILNYSLFMRNAGPDYDEEHNQETTYLRDQLSEWFIQNKNFKNPFFKKTNRQRLKKDYYWAYFAPKIAYPPKKEVADMGRKIISMKQSTNTCTKIDSHLREYYCPLTPIGIRPPHQLGIYSYVIDEAVASADPARWYDAVYYLGLYSRLFFQEPLEELDLDGAPQTESVKYFPGLALSVAKRIAENDPEISNHLLTLASKTWCGAETVAHPSDKPTKECQNAKNEARKILSQIIPPDRNQKKP